MKKITFVLSLFILICASCNDDNGEKAPNIVNMQDCSVIKTALIDENIKLLRETIDPYFSEKKPELIPMSEYFQLFVEETGTYPDMIVSHSCFNCIETLPPMSEITFDIHTKKGSIRRTIDLQLEGGRTLQSY